MQVLYKDHIIRRGMEIEYVLYRTENGYTAEVSKRIGDEVEASSCPICADEKEALRLIKALQKSRVTPCSLTEAMNGRDTE